ncbi:hypothetical protein HBZC1_16580 [Helicobacter bizzozeronii CIII-1]|uniref:Uncharacterized protein n=1 Tax=Helicobacter bizzozeronii (strain CIII-1) TaxID=1002804 RepID=F8KPC5_HELBC|nr:hypothetical protein HBZC1_16580 [Helicobacter bizzozeronii CIII-1]
MGYRPLYPLPLAQSLVLQMCQEVSIPTNTIAKLRFLGLKAW